MRKPPELPQPPLVQMLRWFFRPIGFMQEGRRRHGEIFGVRFLTFEAPMYLISDPDSIKAVYSNPANTLPPGREAMLEPLMGTSSILLQEGAEHMARRKLMLPAFHGERMRSYEDIIRDAITAEMERWPTGEMFSIHPRMQAVTLEVILRAVFGITDGPRFERLRGMLSGLLGSVDAPTRQLTFFFSRSPTEKLAAMASRGGPLGPLAAAGARNTPWSRVQRELAEVDSELYAEIADRRTDPDLAGREDILSMMMNARFEDGEPMSDRELRDQLITLLLAGHETTATALAWTFDLLLGNPDSLKRLREEIDAGDSEEYLRATITETLRLRPVIPIAGRVLAEETVIDGYRLPAQSNVAPAIWMTHTREDIYSEPLRFRPERFVEEPPDTYAWIPYGGGVRRCLGAAFAEFEMRIVISEILGRFELAPVRTRHERVGRRNITLSPRDGTPVVAAHRRKVTSPSRVSGRPGAPLPSA